LSGSSRQINHIGAVIFVVSVYVFFFLVQKYKEFASAFIGNWFLTVPTNTNKRLNKFKNIKKPVFRMHSMPLTIIVQNITSIEASVWIMHGS